MLSLAVTLVSLAHAHPAALPHLHETDPAALALVAFWLVVGAAFLVVARAATCHDEVASGSSSGAGS
jgi:hypothetical protein